MSTQKIGNVGCVITLTITKDGSTLLPIDGSTIKNILIKRADGTSVERTGSYVSGSGTDAKLRYTLVAADITDTPGTYTAEAYIERSGQKYTTTHVAFDVVAPQVSHTAT